MGRIRFKRGTTCSVRNYIDAVVGEPVYDYESGRLYVKNIYNQLQSVDSLGIALEGPTTVYPGYSYDYVINNYSSFKEYNFSHNLGDKCTIERDGKYFTLILSNEIDEDKIELGIDVDNRTEFFNIKFGDEFVLSKPLLSHTDGQVDVSLNPTFIGPDFETEPVDFDSHESTDWQLATDPDFENIVRESMNDTENLLAWSPPETLEKYENYYLRYRYRSHNIGVAEWYTISFRTVDLFVEVPEITSHSDGQTINLNPIFTTAFRTNPPDADFHLSTDWQLATDSEFENIERELLESTTNKTTWELSNLEPGKSYYLRVRHKGNDIGLSEWSILQINTPYVLTPEIISHNDNADDVSLSPTFETVFTVNPDGFDTHKSTDWQLSYDSDFTNIVDESLNDTTNKTEWTISGQLAPNTVYYLRVRHHSDNIGKSEYKQISFSTHSVTISTPEIISHGDGDLNISLTPVFETNNFSMSPSGMDTHKSTDWELATDSNFSDIVDSSIEDTQNKTSWEPSIVLKGEKTYWLRVRHNSFDFGSSNYRVCSLTTKGVTVQTPSIVSHNDGDEISINPTFQISEFNIEPSDLDTYQSTDWELATDSDFNNIVKKNLGGSKTWEVSGLNYETTYYLRARNNGENYSSDYAFISVSTSDVTVVTPQITSHDDGYVVGSNPTFEVSDFETIPAGADTLDYTEWQLSKNSDFTDVVDSKTDSTNTWSVSELENSTSYYLRVRHNGQNFQSGWNIISISTPNVLLPEITSHSDGDTIDINPTFEVTSFEVEPSNKDTYQNTDWELATDSNFENTVDSTTNTDNTWSPSDLDYETTYYLRVRHNGEEFSSDYKVINLSTPEVGIATPEITSHSDGDTININPTFEVTSFEVEPPEADTYVNTDWELATDSNFENTVDSTTNTDNTWSPSDLDYETTYYLRVRHNGEQNSSDYVVFEFITMVEPSEVILTHSDMQDLNTSEESSYDASESGNEYIFEMNADQFDSFHISNFSSNHTLKFINTPTGQDGDINITNFDYHDGEAIINVGDVTLYLSNLPDAFFWDAVSFRDIYGPNSLIVE